MSVQPTTSTSVVSQPEAPAAGASQVPARAPASVDTIQSAAPTEANATSECFGKIGVRIQSIFTATGDAFTIACNYIGSFFSTAPAEANTASESFGKIGVRIQSIFTSIVDVFKIACNWVKGFFSVTPRQPQDAEQGNPHNIRLPNQDTGQEIRGPNIRCLQGEHAGQEIQVPNIRLRRRIQDIAPLQLSVGDRFSIELWHSSSTGHQPWRVAQLPSFIRELNQYISYQDRPLVPVPGDGNDYGFIFEAKEPGRGTIVMELPCSFDATRAVETRFMIDAE